MFILRSIHFNQQKTPADFTVIRFITIAMTNRIFIFRALPGIGALNIVTKYCSDMKPKRNNFLCNEKSKTLFGHFGSYISGHYM